MGKTKIVNDMIERENGIKKKKNYFKSSFHSVNLVVVMQAAASYQQF